MLEVGRRTVLVGGGTERDVIVWGRDGKQFLLQLEEGRRTVLVEGGTENSSC